MTKTKLFKIFHKIKVSNNGLSNARPVNCQPNDSVYVVLMGFLSTAVGAGGNWTTKNTCRTTHDSQRPEYLTWVVQSHRNRDRRVHAGHRDDGWRRTCLCRGVAFAVSSVPHEGVKRVARRRVSRPGAGTMQDDEARRGRSPLNRRIIIVVIVASPCRVCPWENDEPTVAPPRLVIVLPHSIVCQLLQRRDAALIKDALSS